AGIGSTDTDLTVNALAISLAGLHVQNSRGAVRKSNRPRSLIERHVIGEVAIEYRKRTVVGLAVGGVERGVEQNIVQIQADAAKRCAANRKLRREVIVRSNAREVLHGTKGIVCEDAGEILALFAFQGKAGSRGFRCGVK